MEAPSSQKSMPIRNRNCPILVINQAEQEFNQHIQSVLRRNGLVSKICGIDDIVSLRSSSRYGLVANIAKRGQGRPFIRESSDVSFSRKTHKVVIYTNSLHADANDLPGDDSDIRDYDKSVDVIIATIIKTFDTDVDQSLFDKSSAEIDYAPKLNDLIDRLDLAADAVADLRMNSTAEAVAEIREVASALRIRFAQTDSVKSVGKSELRKVVYEILNVIAKVYDHIDNSRLAAIVVSGVTTAIMGCSGLSTPITAAILLASWHGKDAFITAITKARPIGLS